MASNENPKNNIPGVPPPPAEVKVRTMRSDLESMAKSGGGLPQFQNVSVAGLRIERESPGTIAAPEVAEQMARAAAPAAVLPNASAPTGASADEVPSGGTSHLIGIILVVIVAILAIAAVGYFAYTELGGSPTTPAPAATSTGQ